MKIAVINDVHVGKPLIHNGKVRASSHLIEDRLKSILNLIIDSHSPDLLVNLGDLIRSEGKEKDLITYSKQFTRFYGVQIPVIHMLGNHELKKMTVDDLEGMWQSHGKAQKSFGKMDFESLQIIWLGLELDPKHPTVGILPNEQLNWLENQLQLANRPVLIFSHYPLDDHDTTGNFFYEAMDNRSKKALFLENQAAVRNVISLSRHVKAVFQAHLHYFNVKLINLLPFITCPAMGDNICGPEVHDNIPEIYTIITIDEHHFSAKAYSGKYSFAGYEVEPVYPEFC